MNNRIKELAKQAGYRDIFDNDTKARARLEKYTELLIHECATLAFDTGGPNGILEHFGVEE